MKTVEILGKTFEIYITSDAIEKRIAEIARQLEHDYAGKNLLFVGILNGSFMFMSDLMKYFSQPCKISFVKVASYEGMSTTGVTRQLIGLNEKISDYHIIIVEDIVDTGHTISHIISYLQALQPLSIATATLLLKKEALKIEFEPEYTGFSIPNEFVLGFGLDYDGYGRNLKDIYKISG